MFLYVRSQYDFLTSIHFQPMTEQFGVFHGNTADIIALNEAGVPGVIFGKALYEGHLTLQDLRIFLD